MDCLVSYKTCDSIHTNQKSRNDQFCDQSWPDDFDNIFCVQCESYFSCSSMQRDSSSSCDDGGNIRCGGVVVLLLLYPWQSPPHRRAEHHIVTLAGRMMPLSMEQLDTVLHHPTVPAFIHSHWGSMSEQSAFTPPGSGAGAACEQTRQKCSEIGE